MGRGYTEDGQWSVKEESHQRSNQMRMVMGEEKRRMANNRSKRRMATAKAKEEDG